MYENIEILNYLKNKEFKKLSEYINDPSHQDEEMVKELKELIEFFTNECD